jgi:hypothetical protein
MMDIDGNHGYGYSVWFVPRNYKELQSIYKITHIPHITLETNLSLMDAYLIYNNACNKVKVKFQGKFVRFPSLYSHDPMVSYGWYVDVTQMSNRKLNWTPHMTLRYLPRKDNTFIDDNVMLSAHNHIPPFTEIECFLTIADTGVERQRTGI